MNHLPVPNIDQFTTSIVASFLGAASILFSFCASCMASCYRNFYILLILGNITVLEFILSTTSEVLRYITFELLAISALAMEEKAIEMTSESRTGRC